MGKKSKGSCSKNTSCCKVEKPKLKWQSTPLVRTVRVPVEAGVNSMADTNKVLVHEIESLIEQGIKSVTDDVPAKYHETLTFSTNHTVADTGDAKLLTVTTVGHWQGEPAKDTSKPEEPKNERRRAAAAPKGGEAVPGRERRLLDESEFPPEVQAAAAQIRGTFAQQQPASQEGNQEEGQVGKVQSQQTFEVKSDREATVKPTEQVRQADPDTKSTASSLPPSDSNPGQAPSLGGVFDD